MRVGVRVGARVGKGMERLGGGLGIGRGPNKITGYLRLGWKHT